ncbi:hypothetical protein ACFLW4_05845 [Chloroflexota bacterium]
MATIIKDTNFTGIAKGVKPDTRRRVILPEVLVREGVTFRIYTNSDGQIVLDPQVTIPVSESWVFKNPDILALVQRGLSDAAEGRVSKVDLNAL